ncbi:MAG TPA: cysteine--tRNA ligase, partial [Fusobacteria bacterium]|nr:cysteine--tRNA ligase [Fusobacteriota bacterium]
MSKSDGNIIRVRDILAKYSGNVLRFFILSTHYRKPISFNEDSLDVAEKGFKKLVNFL